MLYNEEYGTSEKKQLNFECIKNKREDLDYKKNIQKLIANEILKILKIGVDPYSIGVIVNKQVRNRENKDKKLMSKRLSKGPTEEQKIEVNKDSVNLSSQSILNIFAFGFFIKNNELTYAFNDSLSFIKSEGFILIDNFTLSENSSSEKINEIINIKKMKKEELIDEMPTLMNSIEVGKNYE